MNKLLSAAILLAASAVSLAQVGPPKYLAYTTSDGINFAPETGGGTAALVTNPPPSIVLYCISSSTPTPPYSYGICPASSGGTGTVNSGAAFAPAYYPAAGTAVSGATPFNGLQYDSTTVAPAAATSTQVVNAANNAATGTTLFSTALDSPGTLSNQGSDYYRESKWTSLSAFTQVGTQFSVPTTGAYANEISFTGTSGNFANYISLAGSNNADQQVDIDATFQVQATQPGGTFCGGGTNYGIAIGKLGVSTETTNTIEAFWAAENTTTDALKIMANGTQITGTTTSPNPTCVAVGDTIELIYSQRVNTITFTYRDLTQKTFNQTQVSDTFTPTHAFAIPNSSQFAIWSVGGAYTLLNLKITSVQAPNPRFNIVGNSKTYGFNAGSQNQAFAYLLDGFGPNAVFAGQGDVTADILADTPYALKNPPQYVLLVEPEYNDVGYGIPSATWQANYAATVSAYQAAGVTVYHVLAIPNTGGPNMTAANAWVTSNYPAGNIIDPSVGYNTTTMTSSDNIHPNYLGHAWVAGTIKAGIPAPPQQPAEWTILAANVKYANPYAQCFSLYNCAFTGDSTFTSTFGEEAASFIGPNTFGTGISLVNTLSGSHKWFVATYAGNIATNAGCPGCLGLDDSTSTYNAMTLASGQSGTGINSAIMNSASSYCWGSTTNGRVFANIDSCLKRSAAGSLFLATSPTASTSAGTIFGAGQYATTPFTITASATPAIVATNGLQTITLSANATPTITGIAVGQRITFQICQPATGGPYTWTWPTAIHGGVTIGTTASTCSIQGFDSFNGTTLVAESTGVINIAP